MKYRLQIVKAVANLDVDLIITPANDIEAVDTVRDYKDSPDDGWRLLTMRDGAVEDEADVETYTLRTFDTVDENGDPITITSTLELQKRQDGTGTTTTPADIASAWTEIQALNSSDGFTLIDEHPNLAPKSLIVYERASLWESEGVKPKAHGKANNHGRTGNDLI